jgi:hypothetical protein
MAEPLNKQLYEDVKEKIMKSYKKNSAFASGAIVKEYKRQGGKYKNTGEQKKLKRWFDEKWINVNPLLNKTKEGAYPLFRPTKKINSQTPTLAQEIPKERLLALYHKKQEIKDKGRLPKFLIAHHEDMKKGGSIKASTMKDLLEQSYSKKPRKQIEGYTLDEDVKGNSKVYYNPQTNHTVVAHRGTSGWKDWLNNAVFAVGGEKAYQQTKRYKDAEAIQRYAQDKYGSKNISTIGHSQGGLQAELLGKDTGEIITLNKATRPFANTKHKNEYDVRTERDLVSALNPFEPNYDYTIKSKSINPIKEHSIDTLNALGDKKLGYNDKLGGMIVKSLPYTKD